MSNTANKNFVHSSATLLTLNLTVVPWYTEAPAPKKKLPTALIMHHT
jgi:hypothetical protein